MPKRLANSCLNRSTNGSRRLSSTYFLPSTDGVALRRQGDAIDAKQLRSLVAQWQLSIKEIQRLQRRIAALQSARALHAKALRDALDETAVVPSTLAASFYLYQMGEVSASRWQALRQQPLSIPVMSSALFYPGDTLFIYVQKRGVLGVVQVVKGRKAIWQLSASRMNLALKATELKTEFGLSYPKQDSFSVPAKSATKLLDRLSQTLEKH